MTGPAAVKVIASRLPGDRPLHLDGWDVIDVVCTGEYDYWAALDEWWDTSHVIVNVERDVEVSSALVADLVGCVHPLCTHAYRVWDLPYREPFYAQRRGGWIEAQDRWCDWSGPGFAKMAPEVRRGRLQRVTWPQVEVAVNDAVVPPVGSAVRWHVHWPEVEHYHRSAARESRPCG